MRNNKIILSICLLVVTSISFAQVQKVAKLQIGNTTSAPEASAVLDVTSTTQGFLPPRMTSSQLLLISAPSEGLIVYCKDCSIKGLYIFNGSAWSQLTGGASLSQSSNGSAVVSAYSCSTASSGTLTAGTVVSGVSQTITATVTEVGTYNIITTANGVTFAGAGTFASTGDQDIVLTATGTPITDGSSAFTLNTTPNCNFSRTAVFDLSTNGTAVVSAYSCSTASVGTLTAGTAVSGVTQTITATVTTVGSYNISTIANGVTFSGTGTFASTGDQDIVLTATGTPIVADSSIFTLNTTPNCNFSRTSVFDLSTNGTAVVSAYSCSTASAGSLTVGAVVSGVTQTITATVTTLGSYNISTTANGVTFSGTGTFTGTGAQNIVLTATGTPTAGDNSNFILNTTPNCNFSRIAIDLSTNGTAAVSAYSCSTASAGILTAGTAVSGVTQTITATVTTVGSYNISTIANGVTFSGTGTFTGTGTQDIVLTATGTPIAAESSIFTLNTTPNCDFSRTSVFDLSTNGTAVVSAYSCSTASAGSLTAGAAVSGVTQTITATVITVGSYNISTTANGVTFSGTGTFTGTGAQNIVLIATGTPTAGGIPVFTLNTTPNCNFSKTAIDLSTNGTAAVSAYTCSTASAGILTAGTAVSGVTQTITATVTSVGSYSISTTTANGVTFSGTGTFTGTGTQDIVLTATGTPIAAESSIFTLNTTPNCNFSRTAVFDLSTNGTAVVSAYSCSTASAGSLTAGAAVSGVTQTITATVTSLGSYNISTTANGVTFSGTGTFTGTGAQNIVLAATGTPTAGGIPVFTLNTTPNCNFSRTAIDLSTNGTAAVSAYSCSTASAGILTAGTAVSGVTQTITATVSSLGTYNISTIANGVTFSGTGTFAGTGTQDIVLTATGTPIAAESSLFTLNTTPNCNFSRTAVFDLSTNGTAVVSAYSCSTASAGTLTAGTVASGVTQTITATVITVGSYNISTTANGVTFSGTGTFTGTGAQNIVLTGTGTPLAAAVGSVFTLNTTPNCNFSRSVISLSTKGTSVVSAYSCSTASAGTLTAGSVASGVTQTITATVTSVGSYNISTIANGVTFTGAGTFSGTGAQDIVLTATGTPIAAAVGSVFTLNTTPNCNFSRAVISLSTNGTAVVSAYSCSTASSGTLTPGTEVSGVTQTITATVTSVGTYNISTTASGITFTGSGTFAGTGARTIVLTATGIPTLGNTPFTLNTTPNCNFSRNVLSSTTNGTAVVSAYRTTGYNGVLVVGKSVQDYRHYITATVTSVGTYNISATANGVTFYKSGTFTATGDQAVDLQTSTIPTTAGYTNFTLNTTPSHTFTRSVRVAATVSSVHIGSGVQKEYLSHNLGADTSLDPNVPVVGLQGAYIAWGKRGPNTTGNALVDWQTAPNDGPNGFAAAPTAGNSNSSTISNWVTSAVTNVNTWYSASLTKTALDPCPAGFRIPTRTDWEQLKDNNISSTTGTFTNGASEYGSAVHYGPNASTKNITLPANGRINLSKIISGRGQTGYYWSSTHNGGDPLASFVSTSGVSITNSGTSALSGAAIRCISEE